MTKNSVGRKRKWSELAVLVGFLSVMGFPVRLHAQVVGGTLSGTITDASGAVLPNAQVSIKNLGTGIVRTIATNAAGLYTAPNLLPADYVVTTSAAGFATEATNVTLTVGAQQVLNLSLHLGNVTEVVNVTGVAPAVNLTEPSLGGLDNETTVRELPLNGRSWSDLANLQPGVFAIRTQADLSAGDRYNRGFGAQLSISGARPEQNNYRLNGVSINDHSNGAPGSVLGGNMGVDAISEFSVLTTSYSAEYGKASGGVINAITKSGTNSFHGDVYEFLRNSALDARNYFDAATIPPFRRNQFGASAGGPIRKDKTFIFGDYEGLRQALSISQVDTVPSAAARAGHLTSGDISVDPQATRYLNAFYPLPNGQVFGDTGFFSFARPQVSTENYFTVRVDHKLSDKDSLSGTFFRDNADTGTADEFNNKISTTGVHRIYGELEENHIFSSTTANNFRVGINRFVEGTPFGGTAINPATKDTSFGFRPGLTAGSIRFGGGNGSIVTSFTGGLSGVVPPFSHWNAFQVYDDVVLARGFHSIKFGGGFERDQDNRFNSSLGGGLYQFNALSDFLTNKPAADQIGGSGSAPGERVSIIGTYIQDDWRFRPNLTINMGLRWEMSTVPTERRGHIANLIHLTDALPRDGDPLFHNNTTRNFEPRVGFAWDPFRTGSTSVRGGFGIYDQLNLLAFFSDSYDLAYPFVQVIVAAQPPPGSFPFGGVSAIGDPASKNVIAVDDNPGREYVMQWNLSVQRALTPSLTGMIGYVGSHGVHGTTNHDDVNVVPWIASSAGYLWPCEAPALPFVPAGTPPPPGLNPGCNGIGTGKRLNSNIGREGHLIFHNSSVYDGMQLQLTKRMSHGVQVQGSFTWSRSIDISSGAIAGDTFLNGISTAFDFINPKLTRGPSDFNSPRVFTLNYVWDIPTPRSFHGLEATALGGWELGGVFTASDGQPFTAFLAGDPLGLNSTDAFGYPDRLRGPGCGTLINPGNVTNYIKLQCFALPGAAFVNGVPYLRLGTAGRNILPGPGLENFDFSLIKNTHVPRVSESFNVQFRAEFFNIFNRSNFEPPLDNHTIMDASIPGFGIVPANPATAIISGAGAIDKTATTSRQIQFALKVIW